MGIQEALKVWYQCRGTALEPFKTTVRNVPFCKAPSLYPGLHAAPETEAASINFAPQNHGKIGAKSRGSAPRSRNSGAHNSFLLSIAWSKPHVSACTLNYLPTNSSPTSSSPFSFPQQPIPLLTPFSFNSFRILHYIAFFCMLNNHSPFTISLL